MPTWYCKNLGDALLAGVMMEEIKQRFLDQLGQLTSKERCTVYFKHVSEGRLHCDVMVYFTPNSYALANQLNAIPCEAPSITELGVLISDAGISFPVS